MPTAGKYEYQVVENPGTDHEFIVDSFVKKKLAQQLIDELYEPQDFEELNVELRRVPRTYSKFKSQIGEVPDGTEIKREAKWDGKRYHYKYVAIAKPITATFRSPHAAAEWLRRNCRPMPHITTATVADIMRRAIETASGKWLEMIEPVEVVCSEHPWYGDTSTYANPFAIRAKTTTGKAFVFTRGDFVDAMAKALVEPSMRPTMEKFISGQYSNMDAEKFLRFVISSLQY